VCMRNLLVVEKGEVEAILLRQCLLDGPMINLAKSQDLILFFNHGVITEVWDMRCSRGWNLKYLLLLLIGVVMLLLLIGVVMLLLLLLLFKLRFVNDLFMHDNVLQWKCVLSFTTPASVVFSKAFDMCFREKVLGP